MKKRAIIFGVSGQDGVFLSQLLLKEKIDVVGISRSSGTIKGDIADYEFVSSVVKLNQPDYIFHFAANSTTNHNALFDNVESISIGTVNILEAVRLNCTKAKVFLSGSALQFKNIGLPINHNTDFEAKSPYSVARIHSVYAARYYRNAFDLKIYIGYFFNHDSQLRTERHVNMKISAYAKRISNGSKEILKLGCIDVLKEFNYAGDIVNAVWIMVNQNNIFEVVIGNGITYSIKDWLETCFKKVNLKWQNHVVLNSDYIPEYKILISNPDIIKKMGWQPKLNMDQLADLMMSR